MLKSHEVGYMTRRGNNDIVTSFPFGEINTYGDGIVVISSGDRPFLVESHDVAPEKIEKYRWKFDKH